jgi:hypothetical protein
MVFTALVVYYHHLLHLMDAHCTDGDDEHGQPIRIRYLVDEVHKRMATFVAGLRNAPCSLLHVDANTTKEVDGVQHNVVELVGTSQADADAAADQVRKHLFDILAAIGVVKAVPSKPLRWKAVGKLSKLRDAQRDAAAAAGKPFLEWCFNVNVVDTRDGSNCIVVVTPDFESAAAKTILDAALSR